tara:strand:+ start:339 stop:458 length:120 start_codon:yes stop_codon:yes gene_type:complete
MDDVLSGLGLRQQQQLALRASARSRLNLLGRVGFAEAHV